MRSLAGILAGPLRPRSSRLRLTEGAQSGRLVGAPLRPHSTGRSVWLASRQRLGLGPPLTAGGHVRPGSAPAAGGSYGTGPTRPPLSPAQAGDRPGQSPARSLISGFAADTFSGHPGSTGGHPAGQGALGGWAGNGARAGSSGYASDQLSQPAKAGPSGQLGPQGYFDQSGQPGRPGRTDRTEPQEPGGRGASVGHPDRARSAGHTGRPAAKAVRSAGEPGRGGAWPGGADPGQDRKASSRRYGEVPPGGRPADGSSVPVGRTADERPEAHPGTADNDIAARPLRPTARTGAGSPAGDWSAADSGSTANAADGASLPDPSDGAGPGSGRRGAGGMPSGSPAIPATGRGGAGTSAPDLSTGSPAVQPRDGDRSERAPERAVAIRPAPDDLMPMGYPGWVGGMASPAADRPRSRTTGVSIEIGRIEIRTMAPPRPSPAPAPVRTPARRHVIDPGLSFIGSW
jgi:hypothetical protein